MITVRAIGRQKRKEIIQEIIVVDRDRSVHVFTQEPIRQTKDQQKMVDSAPMDLVLV